MMFKGSCGEMARAGQFPCLSPSGLQLALVCVGSHPLSHSVQPRLARCKQLLLLIKELQGLNYRA